MVETSIARLTRRAMLAGGLFTLTAATVGTAAAQSETDRYKTDLLRNGLDPRAEPAPYPTPGPGSPPPPAQLPSAIPSPGGVVVWQDNVEIRVIINPGRSVEMPVQFALDSAELDGRARRLLSVLGGVLQSLHPYQYLIAGHTDVTGTYGHNLELSMRRAMSVRRHLIDLYGIERRRLYTAGFGPTALRDSRRPTSPINRRVEIVLVTGTS